MIYLIFCIIGFFAFFLKGFMGVGINTIIIAFSTFFIEPKAAVVLASIVSLIGGIAMIKQDKNLLHVSYWLPITVFMMVGGILGAMALKYIDPEIFKIALSVAFFISSFWMIFDPTSKNKITKPCPKKANFNDNTIGICGGFLNGLVGLSAIPIVVYFSHMLDKTSLRRLLILLYLPAAFAQTATFTVNGLLTMDIMLYALCMCPLLLSGLSLGKKAHFKISELWFKKSLGGFLFFISLRLALGS